MTVKSLRTKVFADLETLGFRPANSLPLPDLNQVLRPAPEVAARLMALDAVYTWVVYTPIVVGTARIEKYIDANRLRDWMAAEDLAIIELARAEAHQSHIDTIGWRLENMWALAWFLGFDPAPGLASDQIEQDVTRAILCDFLPGLGKAITDLVSKATPRSRSEVISMEYFFYCAHNAVRSAQLGRNTVPEDFHPIIHGGAVHERRHSLSWCVSPDVAWDDVDLST